MPARQPPRSGRRVVCYGRNQLCEFVLLSIRFFHRRGLARHGVDAARANLVRLFFNRFVFCQKRDVPIGERVFDELDFIENLRANLRRVDIDSRRVSLFHTDFGR